MSILRRLGSYGVLMILLNYVLLAQRTPGIGVAIVILIASGAFFIAFNIAPAGFRGFPSRLHLLNGGCELTLAAIICFTLELLLYWYLLGGAAGGDSHVLLINGLFCGGLLLILLLNGLIRIFVCSRQLGLMPRLMLLLFWWVPVYNIILLKRFLSVSHAEYQFTTEKQLSNLSRKQQELCKTRYPLLMVHGIFFRDWKSFNYWGRVPEELTQNGASIYYGEHQSSASVEQCAGELKECLLGILERTGCEKVNIIAHSKGGLDARYMISCLGMGGQVASLTTINTPHRGCNFVRKLLRLIPQTAIAFIGKKYESLYTKLGDDSPDFFSGLSNLTDRECDRLNKVMQDDPGVYYQSVATQMRSHSSAMFPLNVGYLTIKAFGGGDNDGLVSTGSMAWGNFLGVLKPRGKQGISHGDVIDLTRKNIEGFDVCEFYVDLVSKLKLRGL